jgi:hypothetical protein
MGKFLTILGFGRRLSIGKAVRERRLKREADVAA